MKDPTPPSTPILTALLTVAIAAAGGCGPSERPVTPSDAMSPQKPAADDPSDPASQPLTVADGAPAPGQALATLGAGCFWCVEAVFLQLDGVASVRSGYMGGRVERPTYRQICTGTTGHAEVIQVAFDPARISYETVLEWFFKAHDPTQLNRQGNDVGTQYRSVIFYHDDAQKAAAEKAKAALAASGKLRAPIVTEIAPAATFWVAEDYHQDYYRQNRDAPYCQFVITPKLEKLGLEK